MKFATHIQFDAGRDSMVSRLKISRIRNLRRGRVRSFYEDPYSVSTFHEPTRIVVVIIWWGRLSKGKWVMEVPEPLLGVRTTAVIIRAFFHWQLRKCLSVKRGAEGMAAVERFLKTALTGSFRARLDVDIIETANSRIHNHRRQQRRINVYSGLLRGSLGEVERHLVTDMSKRQARGPTIFFTFHITPVHCYETPAMRQDATTSDSSWQSYYTHYNTTAMSIEILQKI